MNESILTRTPEKPITIEKPLDSIEKEKHLDVSSLIKEKNCYFIHTIQVTKDINVSINNKSLDTQKLSTENKLDILYGANPTISASTLRPHTQDGHFFGQFGVVIAQGEIISAGESDEGTIAQSLTERAIIGGPKNAKLDVDKAIDREHVGKGRSYNEIVLKSPEMCGGFMKLSKDSYLGMATSYEEEEIDYGSGGGIVKNKIGVIDMANNKREGINFDAYFSTLVEMQKRGRVFIMDVNNELHPIRKIDEKTRRVEFSPVVFSPSDVVENYGEDYKTNNYLKQEMVDRLPSNGVSLQ